MRIDPLEPPAGRLARLLEAARGIASAPRMVRSFLAPAQDPSYRGALSAFVRATRERSHPSPDLDDGERSLAVVLAAEIAARERRTTPVEPVP
jgi:predicted dehydrogenase